MLFAILGNNIEKYLITIGVLLATLLVAQLVSKFLGHIIIKRLSSTIHREDLKMFDTLMIRPISLFLLLVILLFTAKIFVIPAKYQVTVFGKIPLELFLNRMWWTAVTMAFVWLLMRLTDYIIYLLLQRASETQETHDEQILFFVKDILKILIGVAGMLFLLGYVFRLDIRSLLGAAGIATLAIALASKETLENLFASVTIFLENTYSIGDQVKVHDAEGVVEKIGFRSTLIRTNTKTLLSIPNKKMIDSTMENLTLRTSRVVSQTLYFKPTLTSEAIKDILDEMKKILDKHAAVIEDYHVFLKDLEKGVVSIEYDFSTKIIPLMEMKELRQEISLEFLELFENKNAQLEKLN